MAKAIARMLTKEISKTEKLPELSKDSLILFFLLIPHLDSHGKMNGDPYFVKGEVCPRFKWFTIPKIRSCLKDITSKTNVKWFEYQGLFYIHSLNFMEHQPGLRLERAGKDIFPNYSDSLQEVQSKSGVSPDELHYEVEEEVEEEVEVYSDTVEQFWSKYPKRNGKRIGRGDCESYIRNRIIKADLESLVTATQHYAESKQATTGYAKDPIRFLKKDYWREWIEPEKDQKEDRFSDI